MMTERRGVGAARWAALALASAWMIVAVATVPAMAASVTNQDSEAQMLIVTERGIKTEVVIAGGETMVMCPTGCFITTPNGDRAVLRGGETIDLISGAAVIN